MPHTDTSALYDAFPHLTRIQRMWGTKECRDFLNDLLSDTRDGTRAGFPGNHAWTIMSLLQEHDRDFPEFDVATTTWWIIDDNHRGARE